MKIPSALLRQRITVEPYKGAGAYGPLYGPPRKMRARIERRRRVLRRSDGSRVVSEATAIVRDNAGLVPESKATVDGRPYEILEATSIVDGTGHTVHVELMLGAR